MPETACIVPECSNKGCHMLPADKDRRDAWIHAIRRGKTKFEKWVPSSRYSYVCRSHFLDDDYVSLTYHGTTAEKKWLKKSAVPSRFAWTLASTSASKIQRSSRYEARTAKRRRLITNKTNVCVESQTVFTDTELEICSVEEVSGEEKGDKSEPVTITIDKSNVQYQSTNTQTSTSRMYSIENFRSDHAGLHFYTGLENIFKFFFVLNTLGPAVYHLNYVYHNVVSIDIPDQFFMVLIKLRRHTTNFELARMFNVSEKMVLNIVITWINFMARQWREIDIWPSKDLVRFFAPTGFQKQFPKTRVLVDGTECPIKKPSNPKSQQKTFSTYKNRNTVKVLVGASPGGLVSFVSSAYGGSASDRQITERSSLMLQCESGDSIMADKGFNVQDLFAPRDVSINIPTFFKKKNRMTGDVVLRDRKISSKRVHIERIIGLAKTFRILIEPMTATETKMASEIIFVCFMLCNFRSGIVPKHA